MNATLSRRCHQSRFARCLLGIAVLAGLPGATAAPPAERTLVHAVADGDQNRILVRWMTEETTSPRYRYYDVDRREAGSLSFVQLNDDPIGPAQTAAEIEAIFTAPGRSDALGWIQDSLGDDYANDLLLMQSPNATSSEKAQAALLPDLNYGVALAFGLGWLDETVTPGVTYVYEVWGLDDQGFRVERLGRATATAGSPPSLQPVQSLGCVDLGDQRGDMSVFLRWSEGTTQGYVVGYDVLRVPRNADGTCPPIGDGLPGVAKANRYPTFTDPPGDPAAGAAAFQAHCASCHPGGRDAPPVLGSTLAQFRRRLYPELWSAPSDATHSGLTGLGADTLKAIYDWVQEFEFHDDGHNTPSAPLTEGAWYCYETLPRDLLGQHGTPSATVQCQVLDRVAPRPPYNMTSTRIDQGGYEICEVSWRRNSGPDDDTAEYLLYRAQKNAPRLSKDAPPDAIATIAQPASGARVTYQDTSLGAAGAGESWFYAARAKDDAGNLSAFSGWVPCTPRDTAAPPPATIQGGCCIDGAPEDCRDLGQDQRWIAAGGDEKLWYADSRRCPPRIFPDQPGDTYGYRLWRGFDDGALAPGQDFTTTPIPLDFQPITDTKMAVAVQTYDMSGNLGTLSNTIQFIIPGGKPLPPPHIISVADVNGQGRIKIRFRSLQPDRLLGFALYKEYQEGDDPPTNNELVVLHHSQNLGGSVGPGEWAVKPGATTLDKIPGFFRTNDPPDPTFLYYNDLEKTYVLQDDVGDLDNLVLRLHAIGWTGKEGLDIPYRWNGWQADTVLDWPRERAANLFFQNPDTTLTVTHLTNPERMKLEWSAANLYGCTPAPDFIVFRKRGSATRWQQMSPPFSCDMSAPDPTALVFIDTDVQAGMSYTYTVIRLGSDGEFQVQYGPTTQTAGP